MQSTAVSTSYLLCCGYGVWKGIARISGMLLERAFALSVQVLSFGHRVESEKHSLTA